MNNGHHRHPSSSSSLGPDGLDLTKAFFNHIHHSSPLPATRCRTKVTVIGAGNVGMAIAQTILTQDLVDELALVGTKPGKLRGEMLDLQHAAAFLPRTKIHASVDYGVTAGSDLCIVAAGARQDPGQSRLDLVQGNVAKFRKIIPAVVEHSPECILLIVSNPVDVLTYVAWRLSGFPANRVIGSGTNLDSSRFRFLLADHLDVNTQDVQDLVDVLALVDNNPDKLRGEMLDLQHAAAFLPRTKISASVDYAVTAASDLCIVTAGARQIPGESRLNLIQRNLVMFRAIIPALAKHSPDCILLIVSNPVDVLTYVAWKLSKFPANRVIGSGTNLDSSRFRFLLADHLDVNAQDVQAYIVGEHGDSSVALWSSITVGGVPVLSTLEKQKIAYEKETLENIRKEVVGSAYEVINLKGYTSWAIGYSAANLARSILRDQRKIHPVSILAKGMYGIDGGDVFLSLPAQLGRSGVLGVTKVELTEFEAQQLRDAAKTILEVQSKLEL